MSISSTPSPTALRFGALGLVAALIVVELLAIGLLYRHGFEFTCRATAPAWFCAFAGRIVPRALGVLAGVTLFMLARRSTVQSLLSEPGPLRLGLGLNLIGMILVFLPWFGLSDASPTPMVTASALSWSLGGVLTVLGLALILATPSGWSGFLRRNGSVLAILILAGLGLPELSDLLLPIWRTDTVTDVTFASVISILTALGYDVISDPEHKGIGTDAFYVLVGPQCSGVEGFMLITVFLTLYIGLFRRELRFPHVLILYPIGLFISWCFNVLRITVLLMIGIAGQPELAIGAFHSYAGWLSFTTLSLLLILASRYVPWFQAADGASAMPRALPPFFRDPAVVQILPFIVFMASALLVSTFSESPALLYPWRAIAMALILALVWQGIRALPWRIDGLAVLSGLAIGAMWIVTASGSDAPPPFAGLTGAALVTWVILRVVGTSLFVPIIEEIFFRGYLFERLAPGRKTWQLAVAVVVSAGLFALLHDRWIEAAIAGVIFGALVWRSNNVTDAIISHAVANSSIAVWVLATGAWHII